MFSVETLKVDYCLYSQQEERVMTYLSVLTGAVGIQYFIRRSVCVYQAVQLLITSLLLLLLLLLLLSTAHTHTSPTQPRYVPLCSHCLVRVSPSCTGDQGTIFCHFEWASPGGGAPTSDLRGTGCWVGGEGGRSLCGGSCQLSQETSVRETAEIA